jgi:hypothetical protein
MPIARTILTFLVALSLAMLPLARAFVASGHEAMASEVVVASAAHEDCGHAAIASDVLVASAHECCGHEAVPADHAMQGCPASADCIAKCFSFYGVLFSEQAIPSPIGGTESRFVSNPFHSQRGSPPFRPPRV